MIPLRHSCISNIGSVIPTLKKDGSFNLHISYMHSNWLSVTINKVRIPNLWPNPNTNYLFEDCYA